MTHFALVTASGDALGPVELGRPDWPPGSIIYRGGDGEPNLRVVDVIIFDDPERSTCSSSSWRSPRAPPRPLRRRRQATGSTTSSFSAPGHRQVGLTASTGAIERATSSASMATPR